LTRTHVRLMMMCERAFDLRVGAMSELATELQACSHEAEWWPLTPPANPHHPAARERRRRAAAYRRRTLVASGAVALLVALALPWGGTGDHPLAGSGPVPAGAAVLAQRDYVVQPGDTLWSIAARLDPNRDPRVLVDTMASEVGGDDVVPGEHLFLP
jgi:hypothetical protein